MYIYIYIVYMLVWMGVREHKDTCVRVCDSATVRVCEGVRVHVHVRLRVHVCVCG